MEERPEYCTDEMLAYLDDLRESGAVNVMESPRLLERRFPELANDRPSFHASPKACSVFKFWAHI